MKTAYYIGGDENKVAETLEKVDSELGAFGVLSVTSAVNADGTIIYTFKITTQNLKRKLDYEVKSDYVHQLYGTVPAAMLVTPSPPKYDGSILTHFSPWNEGQIYCDTARWHTGEYKVYGNFAGLHNDQAVVENVNKVLILDYPKRI